jgi:hypothetical protein
LVLCVAGRPANHNPFKYVKNIFSFYVTGTTRQRARFFVALAMLTLTFLTVMGRGATEVLYQINTPFCWTSVQVRVVVIVVVWRVGWLVGYHLN